MGAHLNFFLLYTRTSLHLCDYTRTKLIRYNQKIGNAMAELTRVQKLHLDLIRCISFNDFDGQLVGDGLLAHADLWVSAISAHSYQPHPVYRWFEELSDDIWSADRLWIMAIDELSEQHLIDLSRTE